MKLPAIAILACLAVLPAPAEEETEKAEPKEVTYEYKGVAFKVHPPENGRMRIEHPTINKSEIVRVDPVRDQFDPGNVKMAKEALDNASQQILNAIERENKADKNRPHLEKELQELYEELAGKG